LVAKEPDLIVVVDTAFETEERAKSRIESIARALDVVASKRPLTAILAGPRPRTSVLDAIPGFAAFCRSVRP